jgi:hypothetical protein
MVPSQVRPVGSNYFCLLVNPGGQELILGLTHTWGDQPSPLQTTLLSPHKHPHLIKERSPGPLLGNG